MYTYIKHNTKDPYSKNSWKWLLIIKTKMSLVFAPLAQLVRAPDLWECREIGNPLWSSHRDYKFESYYSHQIGRFRVQVAGGAPIWRYGRIGRVTTLSPWSFRVQSPVASPDSNSWFCQNIEALILNSLLRGTTTVITITNIRLFNTLA